LPLKLEKTHYGGFLFVNIFFGLNSFHKKWYVLILRLLWTLLVAVALYSKQKMRNARRRHGKAVNQESINHKKRPLSTASCSDNVCKRKQRSFIFPCIPMYFLCVFYTYYYCCEASEQHTISNKTPTCGIPVSHDYIESKDDFLRFVCGDGWILRRTYWSAVISIGLYGDTYTQST